MFKQHALCFVDTQIIAFWDGMHVKQGETRARVYSLSEGIEEKSSEKSSEKNSEKSSEKIIALMRKNKEMSAAEIAQYLELSTRAVEKHIAKLKAEGIIQRIGPDKGGHWEVLEKS